MLSLIYVSTSVKLPSDEELLDILKVSRENNSVKDITGLLLYKGGNFMQVLEGPNESVEALYKKIEANSRHKDLNVLSREQISTRQFPAWQMAFQDLDNPAIKNEPGFNQFLQNEFVADVYRQNPLRAYIMLLTFRDNMR